MTNTGATSPSARSASRRVIVQGGSTPLPCGARHLALGASAPGAFSYGSVCSGIEAASVAWDPLGWRPAFFSEIDAFPRAVLAHRFPAVPLHGDFTTIQAGEYEPIDLLVGGTPCQSFSVAGLRGGLGDDRGNLALEYLRLADRLRPRWLVWENVPGVLSSGGGRDFGSILGGLVELGYGFAYRVLDAQHVRTHGLERAVPQRRRRVFVVGHLGDWRRAAAVLFERESLSGHPAPRRETGQGVAPTIAARTRGGGGLGTDFDCDGGLIADVFPAVTCKMQGANSQIEPYLIAEAFGGNNTAGPISVSTAVNAHGGPYGRLDFESETFSAKDHGADAMVNLSPTLRAGGFDKSHANAGVMPAIAFDARQSDVIQYGDKTGPLDTDGHTMAVAFTQNQAGDVLTGDVMHSLGTNQNATGRNAANVATSWAVRRLTPTECERLQGFPDGWTDVPYRGKPAADGPRYKALGNSMAVNVMRWIGRRIALVDAAEAALPIAAE
jgi:DNA (cytosine-5)-methyltransferase 1